MADGHRASGTLAIKLRLRGLRLGWPMRQATQSEAETHKQASSRCQNAQVGTSERQLAAGGRLRCGRAGRRTVATATATAALLEAGDHVAGATVALLIGL